MEITQHHIDSCIISAHHHHPRSTSPSEQHLHHQRQLVAAADRGWVFGGLGAWNDRSFEDEQEQTTFERISTTLLHALIVAVASGANAYSLPA